VEDIKLRSKDYVNKYKKLYDNYIMNWAVHGLKYIRYEEWCLLGCYAVWLL
jgi:hypothetical protein